jgi:nickel-dependent lactate racemase
MISTTPAGLAEDGLTEIEHQAVARLCRTPKSVAEISMELGMPLQVAKIVLGDMVATGSVVVHRTTGLSGGSSHLALMERVLGGLRRL